MGFLDTLAAGLLDDDDGKGPKKTGVKLSIDQIKSFVQAAVGIVAKIGMPKLIELFEKAGLKEKVMSWISKAPNLPISGAEIKEALGSKVIGELAKKVGIDATTAADALAKYLPKVVDGLTPDGDADDAKAKKALGGFDLGDLGKAVGSLFG